MIYILLACRRCASARHAQSTHACWREPDGCSMTQSASSRRPMEICPCALSVFEQTARACASMRLLRSVRATFFDAAIGSSWTTLLSLCTCARGRACTTNGGGARVSDAIRTGLNANHSRGRNQGPSARQATRVGHMHGQTRPRMHTSTLTRAMARMACTPNPGAGHWAKKP